MEAQIEELNTDDAIRILAGSTQRNRTLNRSTLSRLRSDMQAGRFICNGEPLILGDRGNVLDGHHRLHALATADGTSIRTLVVRNAPETVVRTIDTGAHRTIADRFEMVLGVSGTCAVVVKQMHQALHGSRRALAFEDATAFYGQHARGIHWVLEQAYGLQFDSVERSKRVRRTFVKGAKEVGFLWACLGLIHERSSLMAEAIIADLESDVVVMTQHGKNLLRVLLKSYDAKVEVRQTLNASFYWPRIIVGLNHYIRGTQATRIMFKGGQWPRLDVDNVTEEEG